MLRYNVARVHLVRIPSKHHQSYQALHGLSVHSMTQIEREVAHETIPASRNSVTSEKHALSYFLVPCEVALLPHAEQGSNQMSTSR